MKIKIGLLTEKKLLPVKDNFPIILQIVIMEIDA